MLIGWEIKNNWRLKNALNLIKTDKSLMKRRKKRVRAMMSSEDEKTYHQCLTISVLRFVQQMPLYVLIKVLGIVLNQSLLSINQQILKYCKEKQKIASQLQNCSKFK
jgi:hypothetical protein